MVRRIRLGNIFNIAMTGKGKIVVSRRTLPGVHYTVNLSGKSGVFDFHRTTEGPEPSYETLGVARPEELIASFEPIATRFTHELISAIRPLRLGWLHHNHIGIVSGLFPALDSPAVKKKGSTIELSSESMSEQVKWLEYLEEVYEIPDEAFGLFSPSRKRPAKFVGIGVKPIQNNERVLYWIRMRDLRRLTNGLEWEFKEMIRSLS